MGTTATAELSESIVVDAIPATVYREISSINAMRRWSPEFLGAVFRGPVREGTRFVGFNRRRGWFWFTSCVVTRAAVDHEFAFGVSTFGIPLAEWGFTLAAQDGGTLVTQSWRDLRVGRSAPYAKLIGLVFTGVRPGRRGSVNTDGMRRTLLAMRESFATRDTDLR